MSFNLIGLRVRTRRAEKSRPNILLIVPDDLGYSDLGCFGGEIATPNLDRLASQGVRFTQMYTMARCCPSRASILTGQYPHKVGVGHMVARTWDPTRVPEARLSGKGATLGGGPGAGGLPDVPLG